MIEKFGIGVDISSIEKFTKKPYEKNKPAENFLPDFGFQKEGDNWIYKLNNEIKLPKHLKVEIE